MKLPAHPMPPEWRAFRRGFTAGDVRHPVTGELRPHWGVDWPAPVGTPVVAAADGVVEKAQVWSGNATAQPEGSMVRIRHDGDWRTRYFHLATIADGVVPGSRVRAGSRIGTVGATGRVTGPHLHFELVRPDWKRVDPVPLIDAAPIARV